MSMAAAHTLELSTLVAPHVQGTLFHFLVKKDPELEAARELMVSLDEYCAHRRLPKELAQKMQAYLQFQQQHASAISEHVMKVRRFFA
jgi:hypothetical protein